MSNGFWGNMWISCFFIATFHQIAVYSLCLGRSWILIHLMLEFIIYAYVFCDRAIRISKHPMLKFICQKSSQGSTCKVISKHPMLKFIALLSCVPSLSSLISKHPMLKFIRFYISEAQKQSDFKTSHVKVYLGHTVLMDSAEQFQNISC